MHHIQTTICVIPVCKGKVVFWENRDPGGTIHRSPIEGMLDLHRDGSMQAAGRRIATESGLNMYGERHIATVCCEDEEDPDQKRYTHWFLGPFVGSPIPNPWRNLFDPQYYTARDIPIDNMRPEDLVWLPSMLWAMLGNERYQHTPYIARLVQTRNGVRVKELPRAEIRMPVLLFPYRPH